MSSVKILKYIGAGLLVLCLMVSGADATQFNICGRPANLLGYITQSVQFSTYDEHRYDTEHDFNSALFNFFVEGDYSFNDNLKVFASTMLTVDWIYNLKEDDHTWNEQMFDSSKNELYFDDEYYQMLKELHVTWTPGNWYFRAGKQVVAWGEMLGTRIMDQINPLDQRRGMADVEFESTIVPIWLLRTEYYVQSKPSWVQDLGIEFIFNPNADFIPDQLIMPGNDKGGIWAPDVTMPNPFYGTGMVPPYAAAAQYIHLGSYSHVDWGEPNEWSSEGFEYGLRIKALIKDAFLTLNYFNGKDNLPIMAMQSPGFIPESFGLPNYDTSLSDDDQTLLFHPTIEAKYRDMQFLGFTAARDIPALNSKKLGGVAPMFRLEAFYAFNLKYATAVDYLALNNLFGLSPQDAYASVNEVRWAVSMDWKVKIKPLNQRHYFVLSPQFYQRHILAYPERYDPALYNPAMAGNPVGLKEGEDMYTEDDTYIFALMAMTQYYHGKINPSFFWMRDNTNRADMYRVQLTYDRSHEWHYSVGGIFIEGREPGGFNVFENKDYLFCKVAYRWG